MTNLTEKMENFSKSSEKKEKKVISVEKNDELETIFLELNYKLRALAL